MKKDGAFSYVPWSSLLMLSGHICTIPAFGRALAEAV